MMRPSRRSRSACGFTTVELLVSILIGSMAILMITRMVTTIQSYWFVGTVNLTQLQEARLALIHLRRDFISACPVFKKGEKRLIFENRLNPLQPSASPLTKPTEPIDIQPQSLTFTRFVYQPVSTARAPAMERVSYSFQNRTLIRAVPGHQTVFRDIEDVHFQIYVSEANPSVPILHVRLKIQDDEARKKNANAQPLEITTSISSTFLAGNLNFPSWNFQTYPDVPGGP